MRLKAEHAFLAYQVRFAPQPVDQRTKRACTDFIRQPLAQRVQLEPRRERLGLMMRRDRGRREAFELLPFARGRVALLVAERELDEAAILERVVGLARGSVEQLRDARRGDGEALLQIEQRFDRGGR